MSFCSPMSYMTEEDKCFWLDLPATTPTDYMFDRCKCQGLLPSILLKGLSYTERPKRRMVRHKNHTARKPPKKRESLHLVWREQCTLPSSSTWVLQPSRCGIHRVRAILHPWRSTTRQGGSRKQRVSREDGVRILPGRNLNGYRTLYNCGLLVVVVIVAFK